MNQEAVIAGKMSSTDPFAEIPPGYEYDDTVSGRRREPAKPE